MPAPHRPMSDANRPKFKKREPEPPVEEDLDEFNKEDYAVPPLETRSANPKRRQVTANKNGHKRLNWNDVSIAGIVGRDPELRVMEDGTPYVNLSLAVSQGMDQKTGKWRNTIWVEIVFWGDVAEYVDKYVVAKDRIEVKGRLQPARGYESKSGTVVAITRVRADWFDWTDREDRS